MSSPPPQQPTGWGQPPPPPKPKPGGLPWYQRFWWAIALVALLLGAMMAAAAEPQPETQTRTVPQVSVEERPVFKEDCDYPALNDRAVCRRYMDDFEDRVRKAAAASSATTTAPKPRPTSPPPATIEDGTWAVPDEVKPGTYVSDGGEGCYWARLRSLSGSVDAIIANSISPGRQRVSIAGTDKAFETSNCATWRKVG
jgi:hypothetical protein